MEDDALRAAVDAAIVAADRAQELEDPAVDLLMRARLNDGEKLQTATPEARKQARADPAVWQNGRARARFVLAAVRASLPAKHQNKVRGSIPDLVDGLADAAPSEQLEQLLPGETRALINTLIQE